MIFLNHMISIIISSLPDSVLLHLGSAHGYLQSYLPRNYDLRNSYREPPCKTANPYKCWLCVSTGMNIRFRNKNALLTHLALFHFRDKMKRLINLHENTCPLCDKVFRSEGLVSRLKHAAITHRQIAKLVPRHYLLPRWENHRQFHEFQQ